MCLNTVNYHSTCMTDFFLLLTPTPLFLKLVISSPAAASLSPLRSSEWRHGSSVMGMTKSCSSKPAFAEAFEEVSVCHSVITQLNPLRRHCQLSSSLGRAKICSQATKPIYSTPPQAKLGQEHLEWCVHDKVIIAEGGSGQRGELGCRQGVGPPAHLIPHYRSPSAIIHCSAPGFLWGISIFSLLLFSPWHLMP